MTQEHPITPPPELVQQWVDLLTQGSITAFTTAAQWGADQQLAEDAKWLDHNALNEPYLKIIPMGESLKEAMRPKPPSLKEQAQAKLDRLIALIPSEGAIAMAEPIRRALEQLDD